MHPIYFFVYTNGEIWVCNDPSNTSPKGSGTVLQAWSICSNAHVQKIGTLTGSGNSSSGSLAVTLPTGVTATLAPLGTPELT
jgi:hypothetical protein